MEPNPRQQGGNAALNDGANQSGADVLAAMPAYGEHVKVEEAVPAADSREVGRAVVGALTSPDVASRPEVDARSEKLFRESQDFIINNFTEANAREYLEEGLPGASGNENLKTLAENGLTVGDLFLAGLVSAEPQQEIENTGKLAPKRWDERALLYGDDGLALIVAETTEVFTGIENGTIPESYGGLLKEVIEKRKADDVLDDPKYYRFNVSPYDGEGFGQKLKQRILFGSSADGEDATRRALQTLEYIDDSQGELGEFLLSVQDKFDRGEFDDPHDWVQKALVEKCWKNSEMLIDEVDYYNSVGQIEVRDDYMELVEMCADTRMIMSFHDKMVQAGISEEKMVEMAYFSDKRKGYSVPDYYLARHLEALENSGFSRDVIISKLHDHKVSLLKEEVKDMREAGVDDFDIAYAGRAYEHCYVNQENPAYGPLEWGNEAFSDFDEQDLFRAMLKDRMKKMQAKQ